MKAPIEATRNPRVVDDFADQYFQISFDTEDPGIVEARAAATGSV